MAYLWGGTRQWVTVGFGNSIRANGHDGPVRLAVGEK